MQLRWWAQRTLGKYFTYQLGIRHDHTVRFLCHVLFLFLFFCSSYVNNISIAQLIIEGPYRALRIRHPSYLGAMVAMFSLAFMSTAMYDANVALIIRAVFVIAQFAPLLLLRIPKVRVR